jgi:cellulose synthase operon protein C
MPPPAKQFSPAELAALEHAFATDPSSEAYRPLTEAYLAMGRFMEAMVVCKKGVKGHPADAAPRLLLARIFAAQGKDRKALEELAGALQVSPGDVAVNRLTGVLQLKLGEKEQGTAALRRAWEAAPDDPETAELLRKWGVDPRVAPAPTAKPTAISNTTAAPSPPAAASSDPTGGPPVLRRGPAAPAAAPPAAPPLAAPIPTPPPTRNTRYSDELAAKYSTQEFVLESHGEVRTPKRKPSSAALFATLGLGLALLVVLAVSWGVSSARKAQAVEIDHLLRQARELIEKDSFASYKEAALLCERILERDPDAIGGHAYLAYIDAIRWGEHGESEGLRDEARKHLEAVGKLGRPHSHAHAAEAYLRFHGGDARGAIDELRRVLASAEGASALLNGVLGVLEMQAGDLDAARDHLTLARQNAPGDVRITQMLAEQWRRRGQGYEIQASALYDTALTRLAPDHVPSLLGKAQLLLDADRADEAVKRIDRVLGLGQVASPRQVAVAHALRGWALHAQGKAGEGDSEEQQAAALDPTNPDIHDLVGQRKLRGGDVAGAVEEFQRASQLDPARLRFYVDLAHALLQRPGGAQQAVAVLEKASDRVGNARLTKLLGDAYRAAGDGEKARAAYERAIGMEKRNPEARIALARIFRDRKEFPRAVEELDRAVKEYGESATGNAAPAWIEIGETEEARGAAPEAAEKAYTSALKADPQSCPALFWLGRSRSDRRGKFDPSLAKQMLSDYLRLCPRGPHAGDARAIAGAL